MFNMSKSVSNYQWLGKKPDGDVWRKQLGFPPDASAVMLLSLHNFDRYYDDFYLHESGGFGAFKRKKLGRVDIIQHGEVVYSDFGLGYVKEINGIAGVKETLAKFMIL